MKKIYLAIPYTNYEERSFKLANKISGILIKQGHIVFSPISMSHPISLSCNLSGNWDVWKNIDFEFIKWCDEVILVNFNDDAVKNSIGVQDELKYANLLGKKISNFYN